MSKQQVRTVLCGRPSRALYNYIRFHRSHCLCCPSATWLCWLSLIMPSWHALSVLFRGACLICTIAFAQTRCIWWCLCCLIVYKLVASASFVFRRWLPRAKKWPLSNTVLRCIHLLLFLSLWAGCVCQNYQHSSCHWLCLIFCPLFIYLLYVLLFLHVLSPFSSCCYFSRFFWFLIIRPVVYYCHNACHFLNHNFTVAFYLWTKKIEIKIQLK